MYNRHTGVRSAGHQFTQLRKSLSVRPRVSGRMRLWPIRVGDLGTDQPKPRRSKAAFFEFLPTAAGTRIVSPDIFERIHEALALGTIGFSLLPLPALLVLAVLLGEAVPARRWCRRRGCTRNRLDAKARRGAQCPSIARPRTNLPQPPCNHRPEFQHPAAHALVGDVEPAFGKQFFDIAVANREAQVEPHRMLDDNRRKAARRMTSAR
jgi:hypothetical protein